MTVERKMDIGNGVKRGLFAGIAIILEVLAIFVLFLELGQHYGWIMKVISFLAVLLVLYIYGKPESASMRMPWLILVSAFPVFGAFLYCMLGLNKGPKKMRERYEKLDQELLPLLDPQEEAFSKVQRENRGVANQMYYIRKYAGYPAYDNTDVIYYADGLDGIRAQIEDLKKAEHFIFMEYHAIEFSTSFEPIHAVLKEKAAAGLDVRLFYDYVGSMGFIGNSFVDRMEEDGIRCRVFNPMNPVLNFFVNNRDHRKITVIDGKVGYTGGYNLADEYFHVTEPYGHWLDTGLRLEGEAVKSLTVTFLENWDAIKDEGKQDTDYRRFLPDTDYQAKDLCYVQPYADSPMDNEQVGENVYMGILRNAKEYAWFITPYLIITEEMNSAFDLAVKNGVDVRIIVPGIPDKKLVYDVTRSYCARLSINGVKIYEYTPGFCHAKQCVSDDEVATCGTINLDFRSLYHHFENGAFMYGGQAVSDIKKMFEETFPKCREVTERYQKGISRPKIVAEMILRLFAPLM